MTIKVNFQKCHTVAGPKNLSYYFIIYSQDVLEHLTQGGLGQPSFNSDGFFVLDVLDHLFESKEGKGGVDLVATNIMRGRDHGLPGMDCY